MTTNTSRLYPKIDWAAVNIDKYLGAPIDMKDFDGIIESVFAKNPDYNPSWVTWTPVATIMFLLDCEHNIQEIIAFVCDTIFPEHQLDCLALKLYAIERGGYLPGFTIKPYKFAGVEQWKVYSWETDGFPYPSLKSSGA
jgi:hypothetical protein